MNMKEWICKMLRPLLSARVAALVAVIVAGQVSGAESEGLFVSGLTSQFEINCVSLPDDYYPDPQSCDHYYICDSQIAYKVQCGTGFWYNPVTKHCDWPSRVHCETQSTTLQPVTHPTPPHTTASQEQLLQLFCSAKADGVYRDPSDCNEYIECTSGRGERGRCPLGFVFNDMTLACQQPYKMSDCSA